jgi:Subtilase family
VGQTKRRFLVMPGRGISGQAMQSSVFREKSTSFLAESLATEVSRFSTMDFSAALAEAPDSTAALAQDLGEDDFEIISQRFDDGPATVAMTESARLALEASNPDLRVLPITRYYLPGSPPRGRRKAGVPASGVSAESAVSADGSTFMGDFKQHLSAGAAGTERGTGVIVAVLDTGVDATHPALHPAVSALRCFIPGVEATAGEPVNWGAAFASVAGHGTHVAGIIAARAGFDGPPGVAPNAQLISYRIFPDAPSGPPKPAENPVIIDSIRAAIDDGCHIINLSIEGSKLREDGVRSAIADAWENGVICIAAAGNGWGNPVSYPAALQHCVAVTAIGRSGSFPDTDSFNGYVSNQRATSDPDIFLAKFSNFGPQVQFAAPGLAIVSTFPGGEWWFDSGTSMAAPYVSGLLASVLSDNGNILNMMGNAERSAAMLQMVVGRARALNLPQKSQEGYGLPA